MDNFTSSELLQYMSRSGINIPNHRTMSKEQIINYIEAEENGYIFDDLPDELKLEIIINMNLEQMIKLVNDRPEVNYLIQEAAYLKFKRKDDYSLREYDMNDRPYGLTWLQVLLCSDINRNRLKILIKLDNIHMFDLAYRYSHDYMIELGNYIMELAFMNGSINIARHIMNNITYSDIFTKHKDYITHKASDHMYEIIRYSFKHGNSDIVSRIILSLEDEIDDTYNLDVHSLIINILDQDYITISSFKYIIDSYINDDDRFQTLLFSLLYRYLEIEHDSQRLLIDKTRYLYNKGIRLTGGDVIRLRYYENKRGIKLPYIGNKSYLDSDH